MFETMKVQDDCGRPGMKNVGAEGAQGPSGQADCNSCGTSQCRDGVVWH